MPRLMERMWIVEEGGLGFKLKVKWVYIGDKSWMLTSSWRLFPVPISANQLPTCLAFHPWVLYIVVHKTSYERQTPPCMPLWWLCSQRQKKPANLDMVSGVGDIDERVLGHQARRLGAWQATQLLTEFCFCKRPPGQYRPYAESTDQTSPPATTPTASFGDGP